MSSPAIEFEEVTLAFNGSPLFERFSCAIPAGKCTCLLGPSGCGKSTLLALIAGRENLRYSGRILYDGEAGNGPQVGWMAQDDLLLPWLSVRENVLLGVKLRGKADLQDLQRADEMLAEGGLLEVASEYPRMLSGGMRQRVALLRTLMENRPILLMDEPFSALDALTRLKLQDFTAKRTTGKTVLLVTHDPMEALRLGDRILVLGGRPAQVKKSVEPKGIAPRDLQQAGVAELYSSLLDTVMGEGRV